MMIQKDPYLFHINRHFNKFYGKSIFNDFELNKCFLNLAKELFPKSKCQLGGYIDNLTSNEVSLFLELNSDDAVMQIYDTFKFKSNENLPIYVPFGGKNLLKIVEELEKYSIQKNSQVKQGIYYYNFENKKEYEILSNVVMPLVLNSKNRDGRRLIYLDSEEQLQSIENLIIN